MTEPAKSERLPTQDRMEQAIREALCPCRCHRVETVSCSCWGGWKCNIRKGDAIIKIYQEELAAAEAIAEQVVAHKVQKIFNGHDSISNLRNWLDQPCNNELARHDQELTERVLGPMKALVEKWRKGSLGLRENSEPERFYSAEQLTCADELEALLKAGPHG